MNVFWDGTCDIGLAAPFVGSFGVKEIKFSGRMSILLKPLTNQLPIVSIVSVNAFNEDFGLDPDDDLGTCKFSVGEMLLAGKTTELELQKENGIGTGAYFTLQCDVCELIPDLASFETDMGKNMLCRLKTILATQAFDIPLEKEDASTFVSVLYGEHNFCTGVVVDAP
eukprot:scaffold54739_cov35-Attheya_sp.AAC.1